MDSEQLYVMQETEDEWVRPTPVGVAIGEAVSRATNLEHEDLDDVAEYVDREKLRAVLDGDGPEELQLRVEGHDVTIHASGDIRVE